MEEDIYVHTSKVRLPKSAEIEERLKNAIEQAGNRQAYESAHDEELIRALSIVAEFIRRKKRVCYGGTAMNAILPKEKQFYDPDQDLPDYDFYTPDLVSDVQDLVGDLKAAGFKEVYHRIGIHEGTEKILVNFIAVADLTRIEPDLFNVLYRRSIRKDGLHYTDPDTLRMMMYLELSRPRGQVERWEKVYERLQLINQEFPIRGAAGPRPDIAAIPGRIHRLLLEYCIENQRIVCSGVPVIPLYLKGIRQGRVAYHIRDEERRGGGQERGQERGKRHSHARTERRGRAHGHRHGHRHGHGPILFISPDPKEDALLLKRSIEKGAAAEFSKEQLAAADVRIYLHKARGEIVPDRVEIRVNGQTVALLVKESACHSYNTFSLSDGRVIYVGSLEFLITLYLSLHIFTKESTDVLGVNILAQVKELIKLARENNGAKRSQFPPFSLSCKGHQSGYASLIRKKMERIQRERGTKRRVRGRSQVRSTKKRRD